MLNNKFLNAFIAIQFITLTACGPLNILDDQGHGDSNESPFLLTPGVNLKYAPYDGNASDIEFANTICTRGPKPIKKLSKAFIEEHVMKDHKLGWHVNHFKALDEGDKQKCVKVITKLCEHMDLSSQEIESIPRWRPEGSIAGYMMHLKQTTKNPTLVKNHFACAMYPVLVEANTHVQMERIKIYEIYKQNVEASKDSSGGKGFHAKLASAQVNSFIEDTSDRYRVGDKVRVAVELPWHEGSQKARWKDLFTRIDVIPVAFNLAIASNESADGGSISTSDDGTNWSIRGINFFGRWASSSYSGSDECLRADTCVRNNGAIVALKKYHSFGEAIHDQVTYLNSHPSMGTEMRRLRFEVRRQGKSLSTSHLVSGIDGYSKSAGEYRHKIDNIVSKQTNWDKYDALTEGDVIPNDFLDDL